jgi:hypothetical protein
MVLYFRHMEVLAIEGKNYVKSSVIARELGYTSDYVGQLCRSGKVDAKLFGRTWYVDKNSIDGHKTTRYRSSKALTQRVLQVSLESEETSNVEVHTKKEAVREVAPDTHFYSHIQGSGHVSARYTSDEASLLPKIDKTRNKQLQVNLAEAEKVLATSPQEKYHFEVPSLPEIRFKGRLHVTTIEEEVLPISDEEVADSVGTTTKTKVEKIHHFHPKEVNDFVHKKPKNIAISASKKGSSATEHIKVHETAIGGTVLVHAAKQPLARSLLRYFLHSFTAVVCAALVSAVAFALSSRIDYSPESTNTKLIFDSSSLQLLLENLKQNF